MVKTNISSLTFYQSLSKTHTAKVLHYIYITCLKLIPHVNDTHIILTINIAGHL